VFIVADHGRNILYEVSTETGTIRELDVPSAAVVFDFSMAAGTGEIAATLATPELPTEICLLPGQRRITHLNDKFTESLQMSVPHRVTWRSDGGPELEGWVYLPTTGQKPAPLILWVHGGPYRQHSSVFCHELQVLTGRGYAVFCPNPRGSQGYGEDFAAAIDNDWGNKDYTDLMSGLEYVVARGFGDPHNLGVMGGSYGGYMVNWMVTHTDRFRAAVSDRSLSDLPSYLGTSDGALSFGRPAFGSPWDSENASNLRRQSPVMYASNAHTPTLIMQSIDDDVAPVDQGRQFYLALWESGCETELILFPGSCHNLPSSGRPSLRERRMEWTIAWFDAHMSGAVAF
jgi:dipeptidyl aminopeptidase/acylaminoacyl peptidase